MLNTKFQGHWSVGSEGEFLKVFTIYERGGHVDLKNSNKFTFPQRLESVNKGYNWPSEEMFEIVF